MIPEWTFAIRFADTAMLIRRNLSRQYVDLSVEECSEIIEHYINCYLHGSSYREQVDDPLFEHLAPIRHPKPDIMGESEAIYHSVVETIETQFKHAGHGFDPNDHHYDAVQLGGVWFQVSAFIPRRMSMQKESHQLNENAVVYSQRGILTLPYNLEYDIELLLSHVYKLLLLEHVKPDVQEVMMLMSMMNWYGSYLFKRCWDSCGSCQPCLEVESLEDSFASLLEDLLPHYETPAISLPWPKRDFERNGQVALMRPNAVVAWINDETMHRFVPQTTHYNYRRLKVNNELFS